MWENVHLSVQVGWGNLSQYQEQVHSLVRYLVSSFSILHHAFHGWPGEGQLTEPDLELAPDIREGFPANLCWHGENSPFLPGSNGDRENWKNLKTVLSLFVSDLSQSLL